MRRWLPLVLAVACAGTDAAEDDTDGLDDDPGGGEPVVVVLSEIGFVGHEADGSSDGFDLDGSVTGLGDASGCGKTDLESPDGTQGIDNAFGGLLPLIASLGGEALQSLVQNAVLSGELLLIVELDPPASDDPAACGTGRVVRGAGLPAIGTQGGILPGQTFDVNADQPATELACVLRHEDGSVTADGVVIRLPLQVFDETIDLTMTNGRLQLSPTEAGWSGLIGGGVSVEELATNIYGFDAIPESLENGVVAAIELAADLDADADGTCEQVSVTLGVSAIPAFLFADAE